MASAQQVAAAIAAGLQGQSADPEARKFLEQWQVTPEAWQIADQLLHDPASTPEVQYFCANTLHIKVQRDFEEQLPAGAVPSLRDSLMNLLLRFHKYPSVRTQLCLGLAALAAHVPSSNWDGNIVQWFSRALTQVPSEQALPCMLEILTVLPQEVGNHRIAIKPDRRRQFTEELRLCVPSAFDALTSCLSQPGDGTQEAVLESFGAWLKLTEGQGLSGSLAQHPLVQAALKALDSTLDIFHSAVDAVCELIWVTILENGTLNPELLPVVQLIVPSVMSLRPRFTMALERAKLGESAPEDHYDEHEDQVKGMARLFAEVGEAYASLVTTGREEVRAPVDALLQVASHPDLTIAGISFNFWSKLSTMLSSGSLPRLTPGQPRLTLEEQHVEQERRRVMFVPVFEQLVKLIAGKVRYPNDWDTLTREDKGDFYVARQEVGETLQDAAQVSGGPRSIQLLMEPLAQVSAEVASGKPFDWRTAEAALYCIRKVHQKSRHRLPVDPPKPGDPTLAQLLAALPSLPPHPQLQQTACMCIGGYANWLGKSMQLGQCKELLPRLLQMLLSNLGSHESSPGAASAISNLCMECGNDMLSVCGDMLLQLYENALTAGAVAKMTGRPPQGLSITEDDVHVIVEGVCDAVTRGTPTDQLPAAINRLVNPVMAHLEQALSMPDEVQPSTTPGAQPVSSRQAFLLPLFDRLVTVFKNVHSETAVADMLVRVWPLISNAVGRVISDSSAVERVCRALRYGVKYAGKQCANMLPTLLQVLPGLFQQTHHPVFMYVVSELVKIFGDDTSHDGSLSPILHSLLTTACSGLTQLNDFNENPEMADDTFLLAARSLHYCPRLTITPELLPLLLDTSMVGVLVQHHDACCSVLTFLTSLLDPQTLATASPQTAALLQTLFVPRAPLLARLLLAGVVGALPKQQIKELSLVMTALVRAAREQALQWLMDALNLLPPSAAGPQDRDRFMKAASNVIFDPTGSRAEKEQAFEDAAYELAELCRRNRSARQDAQRALLPPQLGHAVVVR